jgi:hypothetical protein
MDALFDGALADALAAPSLTLWAASSSAFVAAALAARCLRQHRTPRGTVRSCSGGGSSTSATRLPRVHECSLFKEKGIANGLTSSHIACGSREKPKASKSSPIKCSTT